MKPDHLSHKFSKQTFVSSNSSSLKTPGSGKSIRLLTLRLRFKSHCESFASNLEWLAKSISGSGGM